MPSPLPPIGPVGGRSLSLSALLHAGALSAASLLLAVGLERPAARGATVVLAQSPEVQLHTSAPIEWALEEPRAVETHEPPLEAHPVEYIDHEAAPELDDGLQLVPIPAELPGWPWPERVLPEETVDSVPDQPEQPVVEPVPPPATADAPGEEGPRLLLRTKPEYPRIAVRLGQEGTVLLRIHVEADGTVSSVEVASSSGHARLDEAAVEAVRAWTFEPARRAGVRVPGTLVHTVRFRLNAGD